MIRLMKSAFYQEGPTRQKLADFVLSAPMFSMAAECKKFETDFAKKQARKFAVLFNSGSSANLVLIQALLNLRRLKPGAKIGVSNITWATNIMPLIQLGLTPVPLDSELATLNVSPEILKKEIKNLDALFLTNALGFCGNLEKIKNLCEENKVLLLEDNCESLGSKAYGRFLGNFGLAATFSFFVGHHLSTIEGGMLATDDEELADMAIMCRAHGWDRNLKAEKQQAMRKSAGVDDFYAKYLFHDLAYGLRPTEITGFLGNTQLPYWDEIASKREANFKKFQAAAGQNQNLMQIDAGHMDLISNFAMPAIFKTRQAFENSKEKFLKAEVEIRPVIAGDMTMQPFFKKYVKTDTTCPNSRIIHDQAFYLPNNPELDDSEIEMLCNLLK